MPNLLCSVDAALVSEPAVSSIVPIDNATGISVGENIVVTFNIAMDIDAASAGRVTLTQAADKVAVTGPALFDLIDGPLITEDLLTTPLMRGIVATALTWNTARTVLTINPTELLEGNQAYDLRISNELVSRTLQDTVADGGNTGTGSISVAGPWTGTIVTDTYTVEAVAGGAPLTGTFRWQKASDPVWRATQTIQRTVLIEDGITITFANAVYDATDTFTFVTNLGVQLPSIYQSDFTTGSPTMVTPSTQAESNEILAEEVGGITRITSSPTPGGVGLKILSITPELNATDQDLTTKIIRVTFNKAIDATTVDDDTVQVLMETLPTDHATRLSEPLGKTLSVNGAVLTISLNGV